MDDRTAALVKDLSDLPVVWHGVGSLSPTSLAAVARHVHHFKKRIRTIETGSGKSTLLFSNLSSNHLVFSLDDGESMTLVRESALFNPDSVTFIEGYTQETLPRYDFTKTEKVQIVLIDGPHGWPAPDMEFFYLAPLIEEGGYLFLDDIKIPTIGRMCDILKVDASFDLIDIIDCNLAIFKRTAAPMPEKGSGGWHQQGFNRPYFDKDNDKFPELEASTD